MLRQLISLFLSFLYGEFVLRITNTFISIAKGHGPCIFVRVLRYLSKVSLTWTNLTMKLYVSMFTQGKFSGFRSFRLFHHLHFSQPNRGTYIWNTWFTDPLMVFNSGMCKDPNARSRFNFIAIDLTFTLHIWLIFFSFCFLCLFQMEGRGQVSDSWVILDDPSSGCWVKIN